MYRFIFEQHNKFLQNSCAKSRFNGSPLAHKSSSNDFEVTWGVRWKYSERCKNYISAVANYRPGQNV